MTNDILSIDFDKHIAAMNDLIAWMEKLYYSDDISALFTKPVLTMLLVGAKWLRDNLELLLTKYTES